MTGRFSIDASALEFSYSCALCRLSLIKEATLELEVAVKCQFKTAKLQLLFEHRKGKSLSEGLVFGSTNQQYDDRLLI